MPLRYVNVGQIMKVYFKLFLFFLIILFSSLANAADEVSSAGQGPIAEAMCVIYALVTGAVAKTVGVIGVAALGIGLFLGRLNWGVAVAVGVGVVLVFGGPEVVKWLTGRKIEKDCPNITTDGNVSNNGSSGNGSSGGTGSAGVYEDLAKYTEIRADIEKVKNDKSEKEERIANIDKDIKAFENEIRDVNDKYGHYFEMNDEDRQEVIRSLERSIANERERKENLLAKVEKDDELLNELNNTLRNRGPIREDQAKNIQKEIENLETTNQQLIEKKEKEEEFYSNWAESEIKRLRDKRDETSKDTVIKNKKLAEYDDDRLSEISQEIEQKNQDISDRVKDIREYQKAYYEEDGHNVKEMYKKEKIGELQKDAEKYRQLFNNAENKADRRRYSTLLGDVNRKIQGFENNEFEESEQYYKDWALNNITDLREKNDQIKNDIENKEKELIEFNSLQKSIEANKASLISTQTEINTLNNNRFEKNSVELKNQFVETQKKEWIEREKSVAKEKADELLTENKKKLDDINKYGDELKDLKESLKNASESQQKSLAKKIDTKYAQINEANKKITENKKQNLKLQSQISDLEGSKGEELFKAYLDSEIKRLESDGSVENQEEIDALKGVFSTSDENDFNSKILENKKTIDQLKELLNEEHLENKNLDDPFKFENDDQNGFAPQTQLNGAF